jgi:hypothetical protein
MGLHKVFSLRGVYVAAYVVCEGSASATKLLPCLLSSFVLFRRDSGCCCDDAVRPLTFT